MYQRISRELILMDVCMQPYVTAHARVSYDEYIICERGLEEEIAKLFGPREGESRVTRPRNIKTPSANAAPATRLVLSRAGKTLSCDMSYTHWHIAESNIYRSGLGRDFGPGKIQVYWPQNKNVIIFNSERRSSMMF